MKQDHTPAHFEMKPLPFSSEALAPALSKETIDYHYGKHYRGYVERLNHLIANTPFEEMTLEQIICSSEGSIYNNAAQVWNHEFYFDALSPEAAHHPTGPLLQAIERDFGSVEELKKKMTEAAIDLFGSGWVWLAEEESGRLVVLGESNAGNPLRYEMKPLLVLDLWEHAYYIDYRNARKRAIEALWPLIDWRIVEARYLQNQSR